VSCRAGDVTTTVGYAMSHLQEPEKLHDLVAPLALDPQEERTKRSRRFGCGPWGLDEHRVGMRAPSLADPAILGQSKTGLANSGVQAEIADQLFRLAETIAQAT
jgi:hypothetical protein